MKICRNASIECVVIYSLFRQDCDMIIFISFCMYSWYKWIYDLLHWHIHTYWAAVSFLQPFQVWAFSEWHFRIRVASPRLLWNITPPILFAFWWFITPALWSWCHDYLLFIGWSERLRHACHVSRTW